MCVADQITVKKVSCDEKSSSVNSSFIAPGDGDDNVPSSSQDIHGAELEP